MADPKQKPSVKPYPAATSVLLVLSAVASLALAGFKLSGLIVCSWLVVLFPLFIGLGLVAIALLINLFIIGVVTLVFLLVAAWAVGDSK